MAGKVSLDLIGQVVLETRDDVRDLRTELRGMHDDQTVMIRMLQRREAEPDLMRAIDRATNRCGPRSSSWSGGWSRRE